jgi:hypothetical protein
MGDVRFEMVAWMVAGARPALVERYWLLETEMENWRDTGVDLPLLVSKCHFGESDLGVVFVVERTKSCCWRWDGGTNGQGGRHHRQKRCAYRTLETFQR